MANCPTLSRPMVDETHAVAAYKACRQAHELAAKSSPIERELIEALAARCPAQRPVDSGSLTESYATAMRDVWKKHPGDPDVGALAAEAIMMTRPWDQWTADGKMQPGTYEIMQMLDSALEIDPNHPGALHLLIHAIEQSPTPERGDAAAQILRELAPGIGHLVHMPSHIDVRLGRWEEAIRSNERAIGATERFREYAWRDQTFNLWNIHNYQMLGYAASMSGQSKLANRAFEEMISLLSNGFPEIYQDSFDGYLAMPYELQLRFGRWDAALAAPQPSQSYPMARALWHFSRGIAFAAKKECAHAEAEQRAFVSARKQVPKNTFFRRLDAQLLLDIAEKMLDGEILYREGRMQKAVISLRAAIAAEDGLPYSEPPNWILPVRHALGAVFNDSGRFAEADQVYREDLRRHPENGWSLFGLAQSLRGQGKSVEADAVMARFRKGVVGCGCEAVIIVLLSCTEEVMHTIGKSPPDH